MTKSDEACAVTNVLERPSIAEVEFVEGQDEKDNYVRGYDRSFPESWRGYPERLDGEDWQGSIGKLANQGGTCGHGEERKGFWFGGSHAC